MSQELITKLNELVIAGVKKTELEEAIGLPKNSLSAVLAGNKEMPASWGPKIIAYFVRPIAEPDITKQPESIDEPVMVVKNNGDLSLAPSREKMERLQQVLDKINKDFGEGSIRRLGDAPIVGVQSISTGSLSLDEALGVGGLPKGRITEIYGKESSGKTTIALHTIAEAQKRGGKCAFIDVEHAFDPIYAKNIGVDTADLYLSQPDYGEQALEEADRLLLSGVYSVIVLDSVAALVPKAELEGEAGDMKLGLMARLMSQACRKLTGTIAKTNTLFIFINQVRQKIAAMPYEQQTYQPGGVALKFYSSVRIEVARKATIKDGEDAVGIKILAKVVKSKVAAPYKSCEYDIFFGEGIDTTGEIIDLAAEKGIIQKSGSWYSYNSDKIGQGREAVRQLLKDNPQLLSEIELKLGL